MDIVILGAGESGVGAAILAKKNKYNVLISDKGPIKDHYKKELQDKDIQFEENKHTEKLILNAKEVVKSPGIPDKAALIVALKKKGIPVISEIEFAARFTNKIIIGITGSNGKTTTTNLIFHFLNTAGYNAAMCGNVGTSFARLVASEEYDFWVVELSSFQLDGINRFKANIAILLNITADHLDRYDYKMENYTNSKLRILNNQSEKDLLIYNANDDNITNALNQRKVAARMVPVPNKFKNSGSILLNGFKFTMNPRSLKGEHNLFNATCAIHAVKSLGVDNQTIQRGIDSFVNVAHRLEWITQIDGVDFINDSKATNVDSVYYALKAMTQKIVWIAGGQDKGNDYSRIIPLVEEKVKALICLGVDNSKLLENFSPVLKIIEESKSVEQAIHLARLYAEEGDVVLLSPACASFDLFKNYMARGELFKAAVLKLK